MPPHLHPRSRLTTSLFTTTLAISFLVVGMPHILPCPVDPRTYADAGEAESSKPRRRRRKIESTEPENGETLLERIALEDKRKRECPVPKPAGLVGQILGFKPIEKTTSQTVIIRPIEQRFHRRDGDSETQT